MNQQLATLITAMEILPDGVFVIDQAQRIVACNQVGERLFGYGLGELIDQPLEILLPPRLRDAHARHFADYDATASRRPMQERPVLFGVSKSGGRVPLSIGISPIVGGDERFFVAVVRDARSFDDTLENAMLLAETDPLTRLGNRRYLSTKLRQFENGDRGRLIAVLFLDLDSFKPLNDTYGHEVGDEVLGIIARRMRGSVRASDTLIRLGGDEFVVLLEGVQDPAALERAALKLHAKVTEPIHVRRLTLRVGASIGGAIGSPDSAEPETVMQQADAAMYRAKAAKIVYCFHQPSAAVAA
jgi:diguanylate cyclase (GGDEF)-like protein/PAS domain S-box-containing protein